MGKKKLNKQFYVPSVLARAGMTPVAPEFTGNPRKKEYVIEEPKFMATDDIYETFPSIDFNVRTINGRPVRDTVLTLPNPMATYVYHKMMDWKPLDERIATTITYYYPHSSGNSKPTAVVSPVFKLGYAPIVENIPDGVEFDSDWTEATSADFWFKVDVINAMRDLRKQLKAKVK